MRNILNIILVLLVFTACEHDIDRWPGTNEGTGVPVVKIADGSLSYFDFGNLATAEVVYNIDYVSSNGVKSIELFLEYNNGIKKDTFDYVTITTFPGVAKLTVNKIKEASEGLYNEATIKAGHVMRLFTKMTLGDGTVIVPNSSYDKRVKYEKVKIGVNGDGKKALLNKDDDVVVTVGEKVLQGADGKVLVEETNKLYDIVYVIEKLNVDNFSTKINESVFYNVESEVYCVAEAHGIVDGEYSVTVNGVAVLTNKKVIWSVDGPNLTCSHLIGGVFLDVYDGNPGLMQQVKADLIDLGQGQGIKVLNTSSLIFNVFGNNDLYTFSIDVDVTSKVITVKYSDNGSAAGVFDIPEKVIVFTPKK